jgi:hypothetical protein
VWLSLVEHLVRDEGVAGSNPATPTRLLSSNSDCCAAPAKPGTGAPGQISGQKRGFAGRAGNALVCSACGSPLNPKRGSRRQLYCSYWCRDEARRARNFAVSASTRRGSPLIPRPVQNTNVGSKTCEGNFTDRASGVVGPHPVIEVEVLGGRKWREIESDDGVRTQVARLSRKAAL